MRVFALYGVHGAGKSYIAKPVAEDLGLLYIQSDAMELKGADVQKVSPFARQTFFVLSAVAGYVQALDTGRGRDVMLDFGPLQTEPYIKWWVRNADEQRRLLDILHSSVEIVEGQYEDVEVHHVFFLITREDGVERVVERIMRRNRPESVKKEEANRDYIAFIDEGLREIAERMEREGRNVHIIPAELNIKERVGALWSIVED